MGDLPAPAENVTRIPLEAYAGQCQRSMQPLVEGIHYFSVNPLDDEQTRQYLREPATAVPHSLLHRLPPLRLVLVPFLEKGSTGNNDLVCFQRPSNSKVMARSSFDVGEAVFVFLASETQEVADYHYWFYNALAELATARMDRSESSHSEYSRFHTLVTEELNRGARGEVDERSYNLKQKLTRKLPLPASDSKPMRQYVDQAIEDTLTLYLHGLCCDIDVEPGPRQLASRYLRKRLESLAEVFPPNPGTIVFPTEPRAERPAELE